MSNTAKRPNETPEEFIARKLEQYAAEEAAPKAAEKATLAPGCGWVDYGGEYDEPAHFPAEE
jgi:hypothetical protein